MKIIGSVKEDHATEKRISITPETTKKFVSSKFKFLILIVCAISASLVLMLAFTSY